MARKIVFHTIKQTEMRTAAQQDRMPGATPENLRKRMSELYADYFSEVGQEVYQNALSTVSGSVEKALREGVDKLRQKIKDELGRKGYEAAIKHVRPWLDEIVRDLRTEGFSSMEWADKLKDLATSFSVETSEKPELEGDELTEVAPPEEAAEEVPEEEVEEVSDNDLAAILNQGTEAPATPAPAPAPAAPAPAPAAPAPAPAPAPAAAASTAGDLKRKFVERRRQRKVQGLTAEDLLTDAEKKLRELKK